MLLGLFVKIDYERGMAPKLSVNINKVATLRNARGGVEPCPIDFAIKAQEYGAQGITVHPRPDQRHIRYEDVLKLRDVVHTEFNIEGYPNESFLELVEKVRPEQVTLVPDPPHILTSNAGWNTREHVQLLSQIVERLHKINARVSIFLDPDPSLIESAKQSGADRIELYTESYAKNYAMGNIETALEPYVETAKKARNVGLQLNAGHDLNTYNLADFCTAIEGLSEVSIGHALISDCLYWGLEETLKKYLSCLSVDHLV